jgi:hypothetical protein
MEGIIENGITCIFDILGYKNFIKNNNVFICAENIKNIITKLPDNVNDRLLKVFDPMKEDDTLFSNTAKVMISNLLENNFRYITVSDTIILSFDFTDLSNDISDLFTMVSLLYINIFQEISFEKGFPMRACVDIGSFYYNNNILAGETIINCFSESERLNFSGIILTNNTFNILKDRNTRLTNAFIEKYIVNYIVPINNKTEEYKYLIKWTININNTRFNDLRQAIFESFHAHNKEVNFSVMEKINNTEKIIRFFHIRK